MTDPLISVILVCKNPGPVLHKAIESVWKQRNTQVDIVVVDGGSTDGTLQWLKTQESHLGTLISEADRNVYDAMNKGVVAAKGDWILFLGADDSIEGSEVLSDASKILSSTDARVVAGTAIYDDGRTYRFLQSANPCARNFVHHQATFYERKLFAHFGMLDSSLSIMGDYDFNLRLWRNGVRFMPISLNIALCHSGGLSDSGKWQGYVEEICIRRRHFPACRCWLWDVISIGRFIRKGILRKTELLLPSSRRSHRSKF